MNKAKRKYVSMRVDETAHRFLVMSSALRGESIIETITFLAQREYHAQERKIADKLAAPKPPLAGAGGAGGAEAECHQ